MKYYASAAVKTLSFFALLPIATQLLSKAEVGKFFFWIAVVQIGAVISTLGYSSAIARRSYNKAYVDYLGVVGLVVSVVVSLILLVGGSVLSLLPASAAMAWLARSAALIGESRTVSQGRIGRISKLYAAYAVALPCAALMAVYLAGPTYEALLFGFIIGEGITAVGGLAGIRFQLRIPRTISFRRFTAVAKSGAVYGMPIMIAGLANMGLSSADRFIVAGFWDFRQVADFSIMYTIAFASGRFITAPTNLRVFPEFVRGQGDERAIGKVRRTTGIAFVLNASYCALITVFGPSLVRMIGGDEYQLSSVDFALVSAAASLFLIFTINSSHLKLRKRTGSFAVLLFGALFISLSASLILVPELGYRGASISTLVSYSTLAAYAMFRLRPMLLELSGVLVGLVLLLFSLMWAFAV